jgi:dihydropyrimidine dehydrogenase (NAD+) subunit PreT
VGLGGVRALEAEGAAKEGVRPAVDFIAELRQARDLAALPVGRRVVVIGGGMTAIDAGVQAKKLGAEEVTIAYRRGRERMAASAYEQELAANAGVRIVSNAVPVAVSEAGMVFAYANGGGRPGEERFEVAADQVLTAIGQRLGPVPEALAVEGGKIVVTGPGRTSRPGVWAGGDCASGGDDLTVTAVAEGRDAAMDIHAALMARP